MSQPASLDLFADEPEEKRTTGDGGGFAWQVHSMSETTLLPVELFSGGFTRLRAITYSHSIPFIAHLAKQIETIEVVLGSPKTMTARNMPSAIFLPDIGLEVEAEKEIMESLRKYWSCYPSLERVKFYVAIGKPSHEKLFLLDSPDGKSRAIFGSGNLSFAAFSGWQEESAYFCDDREVFGSLEKRFLSIRSRSVEPRMSVFQADAQAKELTEELPADAIPIVLHTQTKQLRVVKPDDPQLDRAIHLVHTETALPDVPQKPSTLPKDVPALVQKIVGRLPNPGRREKVDFLPVDFDFEEMVVRKGDAIVADLTVERDFRDDLNELDSWFSNYRSAEFIGNPDFALRSFEILLVFALVCPFLAHLHHHAAHFESSAFRYPINAIVFGPSSGGKTSFIESLRPLTFRHAEETSRMEFTNSSMMRFRVGSRHGLLIKDDVPKKQILAHLESVVKTDEAAKSTVFAPLIVSANREVDSMDAAILKRAIPIWIDAHAVGAARAARIAKIGQALQSAFIRAFRPVYFDILAGHHRSEHILVTASRVLSSIAPQFLPIDESEIQKRTYESFRRAMRRVIAEKLANKTVQRQNGSIILLFDTAEIARNFFASVPEDAGAELGEKTVRISEEGLLRVGLRLNDRRNFMSILKSKSSVDLVFVD